MVFGPSVHTFSAYYLILICSFMCLSVHQTFIAYLPCGRHLVKYWGFTQLCYFRPITFATAGMFRNSATGPNNYIPASDLDRCSSILNALRTAWGAFKKTSAQAPSQTNTIIISAGLKAPSVILKCRQSLELQFLGASTKHDPFSCLKGSSSYKHLWTDWF